MKRMVPFFLLLALLGLTATAQQQFAMLSHNGTLTPYYGVNALTEAHAAAVNGDIITLSAGMFNAVDLTKAITLRGAGIEVDSTSHHQITTISGNFKLNIPDAGDTVLIMERLHLAGDMKYQSAYNPQFTLCRFAKKVEHQGSNSYDNNDVLKYAMFSYCIFHGEVGMYYAKYSTTFYNCLILGELQVTNGNNGNAPLFFDHCIMAEIYGNMSDSWNVSNCVLIDGDDQYESGTKKANATNCIGIQLGTVNGGGSKSPCFADDDVNGNTNAWSYGEVFKEFDGTWKPGMSFALQDSLASRGVGIDTEMYELLGRNYYTLEVAKRSTPDGKLEIKLQPTDTQE